MADILPRKLRFDFDEAIDLDIPDAQLSMSLVALGISLTMPYLEPYLIRTMKAALHEIGDAALATDVRHFSQQEGHHYRNHAVFNEKIRGEFSPEVAASLKAIENRLEADYQRFTRVESLRFNVAYAEGFEAMTCGFALASAEHGTFRHIPGRDMFTWHMAEEIEHRTVAFGVFEHLDGNYFYRIKAGSWSQWHYIKAIHAFMRQIADAIGRDIPRVFGPLERTALRNYLRTLSPAYHPSRIEVPAELDGLLADYTARAEAASSGV